LRLTVPFNLDATLCCGQVFRWERRGEWWLGVVEGRVVKVRQCGCELEFSGADEAFVKRYFCLNHDLQWISEEVGRDEHVRAALRQFWGLRLIRQEPWECLASFICATYKSVAAIRLMLGKLSLRFGERLTFEGGKFCGFPSAAQLAGASVSDLKACGLGYRAKYLLESSRMVSAGGYDVETLHAMTYSEAKHALLAFPGVGLKVADCVLLFGLGKLEAFPVDVWVKRILLRHYAEHFPAGFVRKLSSQKGLSDSAYKGLNEFGRTYFGGFAGYAQEYLYHYERCLGNRKVEKEKRAIA
jgi:N-glycosylase/DNA lyase